MAASEGTFTQPTYSVPPSPVLVVARDVVGRIPVSRDARKKLFDRVAAVASRGGATKRRWNARAIAGEEGGTHAGRGGRVGGKAVR